MRDELDRVKEGQDDITTSLCGRRAEQHYNIIAFSSLVGGNVALSFSGVLTRDWVNVFLFFRGVSSFVVELLLPQLSHPAYSLLTLVSLRTHLALSSHGPQRALIAFAVSHSGFIDPNLFVLWKTLGSGSRSCVGKDPLPSWRTSSQHP